jgi:Carboxypeptidase regulatory-like domain
MIETRMRGWIRAIVVGLLMVLPGPAGAQSSANVAGRTTDQTGAVLPGVAIYLAVNGTEFTTTTDGEGRYRFENVPAGTAELTYRLINFGVARRIVDVAAPHSGNVDVTMTLSLNADVVVTGADTFRNIADAERPAENLVGLASSPPPERPASTTSISWNAHWSD